MKSIFFSSVDGGDDALAYELIQICKKLSSMEILILSANYNVVKGTSKSTAKGIEWGANRVVGCWAQIISEQVGHNLSEVVLRYEDHLIEIKLISDLDRKDKTIVSNTFIPTSYFRLTPLGYKLCEFITKYD